MPRGRKPGTKLSAEHREALSRALQGQAPWNKGTKKVTRKVLLSPEERAKITQAAVAKAAQTRRQRTAQRYIALAGDEWTDISFDTVGQTDYISATHVPCGQSIRVQTQTVRKWSWSPGLCHTCNPVFRGSSGAEEEVAAFCQQFTTIERRVKVDGLEYDIIVRDRKVAIEYDGLYWHSELAGYPRDRHLKKTELLEADGWTVIHIFEDEWVRQRPIVENRLRHLLGGARRRVGARQCDVRPIKSSVSKPFLDKHHIQGSVAARHHLGLYLGDELLAVATFGVARFRRDFDWELLRFSGAEDVVVPGAIGRLVAHFRRSHGGSIVSYADRRWGRGTTYEAIGFELIGTSPPAYFYFKGDLRQSRLSFQKARLRDLPSYSPEKSEAQIMAEEGWNRIYDCGTRVFGLRA